jgi:hypothetical protein
LDRGQSSVTICQSWNHRSSRDQTDQRLRIRVFPQAGLTYAPR